MGCVKQFNQLNSRRWFWGLAAVLVSPAVSFAQGCAMCYNDAAATHKAGIAALQHGVLILGIPVLSLFAGILVMVFRRRNRFNQAGFSEADLDREVNDWLCPLGPPTDRVPSAIEKQEVVHREI